MGKDNSGLKRVMILLNQTWRYLFCLPIYVYQTLIRPVLPPCCRFYPSCSNYAIECLKRHSFLTAMKLIVIRLAKCHPWHKGGIDSVPNK